MKKPPFPNVLSTTEVCDLLGVSRTYVNILVDKGKLRCQNTSAGKIFLEWDVLEFKKDRERRAKSDPRIQL